MAVDELVRFILHNFIASIVENLYLYTIFTNHLRYDSSSSFNRLSFENNNLNSIVKYIDDMRILGDHVFAFDYFEQSLSVFELQYMLFSDVMDFNPSEIVKALKRVRHFASPCMLADKENRIGKLKSILMNTYSWSKIDVDSIDLMNYYTIEHIVHWFEKVIYMFGNLTELISREKMKYNNFRDTQ